MRKKTKKLVSLSLSAAMLGGVMAAPALADTTTTESYKEGDTTYTVTTTYLDEDDDTVVPESTAPADDGDDDLSEFLVDVDDDDEGDTLHDKLDDALGITHNEDGSIKSAADGKIVFEGGDWEFVDPEDWDDDDDDEPGAAAQSDDDTADDDEYTAVIVSADYGHEDKSGSLSESAHDKLDSALGITHAEDGSLLSIGSLKLNFAAEAEEGQPTSLIESIVDDYRAKYKAEVDEAKAEMDAAEAKYNKLKQETMDAREEAAKIYEKYEELIKKGYELSKLMYSETDSEKREEIRKIRDELLAPYHAESDAAFSKIVEADKEYSEAEEEYTSKKKTYEMRVKTYETRVKVYNLLYPSAALEEEAAQDVELSLAQEQGETQTTSATQTDEKSSELVSEETITQMFGKLNFAQEQEETSVADTSLALSLAQEQEQATGEQSSWLSNLQSYFGDFKWGTDIHIAPGQEAKTSKEPYYDQQHLLDYQGTDIHVAPGQEAKTPHDPSHVQQQTAGKTEQESTGLPLNDNAELEKEAEKMAEYAKLNFAQEQEQAQADETPAEAADETSVTQQFGGLSMASLIGGPLSAAADATAHVVQETQALVDAITLNAEQ